MTGQPLNPHDTDNTEILDIKPKNTFLSGLQGKFKSSRVPKVGKPVMTKPTLDKKAATNVPLSRPTKRLPKEPGQAPRVAKPGLALATSAQQRKLIPMVGVFLMVGAVSLYVNFSNASTEKPVTAFVMPGPGQPGYIPAPGTMNTTATGSAMPGAASNTAGFTTPAQTTTNGTAGTPPAIPETPEASTANPGGVVISTSAPPTAASTTTPGNTPKATGTATAKGSANPAGTTTKAAQVARTGKGTPAAAIPGAPGSKAAPTDVPSEPVIPDVFAVAEDKNASGTGGTGGTGSAGASGNGNATGSASRAGNGNAQGAPSGVNVTTAYAPPAALRNVPLAPVPRQVQVAVAAPMSIQSLPAPTPVTPPPAPQVRSVPTLSAVPVPLPRAVQVTPVPQPVSLPLQSPVTVRPATGVTLTPGGATAATPAAAPSVVLVGTASGDTPTAILATPAGQMIAGIGDHVTVNDLDYTVSKIDAKSVTMTHLKDTLTLTEIN